MATALELRGDRNLAAGIGGWGVGVGGLLGGGGAVVARTGSEHTAPGLSGSLGDTVVQPSREQDSPNLETEPGEESGAQPPPPRLCLFPSVSVSVSLSLLFIPVPRTSSQLLGCLLPEPENGVPANLLLNK